MALSAGKYQGRVGDRLYVDTVTGTAVRNAALDHIFGKLGRHYGGVRLSSVNLAAQPASKRRVRLGNGLVIIRRGR